MNTISDLQQQEIELIDNAPEGTSPDLSGIQSQMNSAGQTLSDAQAAHDAAWAEAEQTFADKDDAAWNIYVGIESGAEADWNDTESQAEATYDQAIADAGADWDDTESHAYDTYEQAIADAQSHWDDTVSQAETTYDQAIADAQSDWGDTESQAETTYNQATADASADWDDTESQAAGTYDQAIADAQSDWNYTESQAETTYNDAIAQADAAWQATETQAWANYSNAIAQADADWDSTEAQAWAAYCNDFNTAVANFNQAPGAPGPGAPAPTQQSRLNTDKQQLLQALNEAIANPANAANVTDLKAAKSAILSCQFVATGVDKPGIAASTDIRNHQVQFHNQYFKTSINPFGTRWGIILHEAYNIKKPAYDHTSIQWNDPKNKATNWAKPLSEMIEKTPTFQARLKAPR